MVGWLRRLYWYFCMSNSIDRLLKNYCNSRKSWEAWCYLAGLNDNLEQQFRLTKTQVDNSPLLSHLRFLAMKDYHIELYKVLKKSNFNKDNLFLLLEKRLRSNPKNKNQVEVALYNLNDYSEVIDAHCNVRDKYYAHLDKDYKKYIENNRYVSETHHLFHLIEKGIIELTSLEVLQSQLKMIESRKDYNDAKVL